MAFFVSDVATEQATYSTTRLAAAAVAREHEVWYVGADDLAYDPDEAIRARARRCPTVPGDDLELFLGAVQRAAPERIAVDDLDVLMLRSDPTEDLPERPWAQAVGVIFGDLASQRGVLVLNHPGGLARALNKLYFQHFPAQVRPRTLVTRDHDELAAFVADQGGRAVLKPLQGSGGQSVFVVGPEDHANLRQMIEAVSRDGYVVAQEYLPAATEGDVRLFLLDAEPLVVDGHHAAFRRRPSGEDPRSNMRTGARAEPVEVDRAMLSMAEIVRPVLARDGMFLVGLDIAGDRLMEINVLSPGGLGTASRLTGVDFPAAVIAALERKVEMMTRADSSSLRNVDMATD